MNDIDARITLSSSKCRIEPVSDTARDWLEQHVFRMTTGYEFGPVQGKRVHDDMLKVGMTLHIVEVTHHFE